MMLLLIVAGCWDEEETTEQETTEACCVIGEGPWNVQVDDLAGEFPAEASGRIWAIAVNPDGDPATHDWSEYADKLNDGWHWLDGQHRWHVTVPAEGFSLACGGSTNPCEKITVLNVARDPSGDLLEVAPNNSTPASYHADGRYLITTSTGKKAYFYTRSNSSGGRDEAFCAATDFRWPTHAGVEWTITPAGTDSPPANINGCPADAKNKFMSYPLVLG